MSEPEPFGEVECYDDDWDYVPTPEPSDPDTAELVAIYRYIKAHPKEWEQRLFAARSEHGCRTAYCLAGHAVVRAGYKLVWEPRFTPMDGWYDSSWFVADTDTYGQNLQIAHVARKVLGLNPTDADKLFCATNTLDDLRRIITEVTGTDPEEEAT